MEEEPPLKKRTENTEFYSPVCLRFISFFSVLREMSVAVFLFAVTARATVIIGVFASPRLCIKQFLALLRSIHSGPVFGCSYVGAKISIFLRRAAYRQCFECNLWNLKHALSRICVRSPHPHIES